MAKGYKIRVDIKRNKATFIRMESGARGRLYRAATITVDRDDLAKMLDGTKMLDSLEAAAVRP
jgi:hypothetical protein